MLAALLRDSDTVTRTALATTTGLSPATVSRVVDGLLREQWLCFRPQVFVTRGRTQAATGLRTGGAPTLHGRYDVDGRPVQGVG